MPTYNARVELLNSKSTDAGSYAELHTAMEAIGLLRKIKSDDGIWYELPPAEYRGQSVLSSVDLRNKISELIAEIWTKGSRIYVTQAVATAWVGLKALPSKLR